MSNNNIYATGLIMVHVTTLFKFRNTLSKILPRSVKGIIKVFIRLLMQSPFIRLITPKISVIGSFNSINPALMTLLIVSHEGFRTGAPIVSYNLIKHLVKRYNVVALFLGPGPLLNACNELGAIVVGPVIVQGSFFFADQAINKITKKVHVDFALINSIESRYVLPALVNRQVPTITLIHEFAANTQPRDAFSSTVTWSGQTIFSTRLTRDNMLENHPELCSQTYPVIPQGRCVLPEVGHEDEQWLADDIYRIQNIMRPDFFPINGVVVLGAGLVQYRKGVDLFIECAAKVLLKAPNMQIRFIWVGKGYDPEYDMVYSAYLADQINRSGLEKHVHFVGEAISLEPIYESADIFLLSSRLDPLPNVAIDALVKKLPVICFDKTSGIADILKEYEFGDICVADFLNMEDMASKVIKLAESKELRQQIAERSGIVARKMFDMPTYVNQIEQLGFNQIQLKNQLILDADTIVKSKLIRQDFYHSPSWWYKNNDSDAISTYVNSWASKKNVRKLFPGFHPGIYLEQHGVELSDSDPLADYVRAGQPKGAWSFELITPATKVVKPIAADISIGLHIHVYYPNLFPQILERLEQNLVRPDLLITVTNEFDKAIIAEYLHNYKSGTVDIRIVPNRGRDIGPFLTEFGELILQKYDLIGHLHTKKSAYLNKASVGKRWSTFLLGNLLGNASIPMADIILARMLEDDSIGLVFPDDPHSSSWYGNRSLAEPFATEMGLMTLPEHFNFPVGSMFWARSAAIAPIINLSLEWSDYPEEPIFDDGTVLHVIERLFSLCLSIGHWRCVLTNVPGLTR